MSVAPGDRAKLLNALDNQLADELQPLYSIDIILAKSPKSGVKCGAINVFRLNMVDLRMDEKYDFTKADPRITKELEEAQARANQQTEVMHRDPILFRETDGRGFLWALNKALDLFDQLGGSARIAVKCPRLDIEQRRSPKMIAQHRSDLRYLFPVAWDIDRLLDGNFSFDPWGNRIRRGRISAEMSKR